MRYHLKKFHWILSSQFGLDLRLLFQSIRGIPVYLYDLVSFRKNYKGKFMLKPCLHDRYQEGGSTKSEYFWQDLLVARAIYQDCPNKHVDIGSRVDGFVAHVASFRECEVFDVRSISTNVPGVIFSQADLMDPDSLSENEACCDSLSCLHAIEHFGLGRYGDPVNPKGYKQGLANMAKLLKSGGTFYLSTPIGIERVEFNANWVFDPRTIIQAAEESGLILKKLIIITPENEPIEFTVNPESIAALAQSQYQLGLFIFNKSN